MASNWIKLKKGKYDWMYSNDHTDFDLLQRFIEENGFVSVSNCRLTTTMKWFLEHGKDVGKYHLDDEPPQDNHGYYFKYPSGKCAYVYHPYADKVELESELKQYANKLSLQAVVYESNFSWYYPHNSLLVVISLPYQKTIVPNDTEHYT